jgi:hypothetical protein
VVAEQHETSEKHKSWIEQWSDADKRLFLITFVGGLTANVGLVIVLALAYLAARALTWFFRKGFFSTPGFTIFFCGLLVCSAFVIWSTWYKLNRKTSWRFNVVLGVAGFLPGGIILLGLLGYAAGIR